jgi:hypothetical protein
VRSVLVVCLLVVAGSATAASRTSGNTISTTGVTLRVPTGWHAAVSRTPDCDPERLIVASSEPLRISADGRVASPTSRAVIVLLLEDRQIQDRPLGDLRVPSHFQIDWNSLRTLAPDGYQVVGTVTGDSSRTHANLPHDGFESKLVRVGSSFRHPQGRICPRSAATDPDALYPARGCARNIRLCAVASHPGISETTVGSSAAAWNKPGRPHRWSGRQRPRRFREDRRCCAIVQPSRRSDGMVSTVGVMVPTRSLDQRLSALQRANEVRVGRSQLKKELAAGTCRIEDLLTETPELAVSAKIYDLLLAVPKFGRVRVSKLLRHCRISEAKTLGGLTERQRAELLASLRY